MSIIRSRKENTAKRVSPRILLEVDVSKVNGTILTASPRVPL